MSRLTAIAALLILTMVTGCADPGPDEAAPAQSTDPAQSTSPSQSDTPERSTGPEVAGQSDPASPPPGEDAGPDTASASPQTGGASADDDQVARPHSPGEYGDLVIEAWISGDRDAAAGYMTEEALNALFAGEDPGGVQWQRIAGDDTSVTYANIGDGEGGDKVVTLSLDPARVAEGQSAGVTAVSFTG